MERSWTEPILNPKHRSRMLSVAVMLGVLSATLYASVRLAYFEGILTAGGHDLLQTGIYVGSLLLGIPLAGVVGRHGLGPLSGIGLGVSPSSGCVAGSYLVEAAGFGDRDAFVLPLVVLLLLAYGIVLLGAWRIGAMTDTA